MKEKIKRPRDESSPVDKPLPSPKAKENHSSCDGPSRQWLIGLGVTGLQHLRVSGGCLWATEAIPAGEDVLSIPRTAIMTSTGAMESRAGIAARAAVADITKEQLMWVWMASEREDNDSPWFPYLSSLPYPAPDPINWGPSLRQQMSGILLAHVCEVEQSLLCLAEKLQGIVTFEGLKWARGTHRSRRFQDTLCGLSLGDCTGGCGVMIPLLDMANHSPTADVAWPHNESKVCLRVNYPIAAGQEVFNNYGPKGNEALLFDFGFCLRDNLHDSVSLCLCVEDGGSVRRLGPFHIHRGARFPPSLWEALGAIALGPLRWFMASSRCACPT